MRLLSKINKTYKYVKEDSITCCYPRELMIITVDGREVRKPVEAEVRRRVTKTNDY